MKSHLSRGRMLRERDQFMALLPDLKAPALRSAPPTPAPRGTDWMDEYLPKWEAEFGAVMTRTSEPWELQWERMCQQALRLYPKWDPYDYEMYQYDYDWEEAWPEYANPYMYDHVDEEFDEGLEWTAWWAKN